MAELEQVYLPKPYRDEPLYGVAARYATLLDMRSHMRLTRSLFGDGRLTSVDLPTGLDVVARRCGTGLDLDLAGIISELTLAPLYLRFASSDLARACMAAMATRSRTSVSNMLGLATSRVRRSRTLRFCPMCAREQRAQVGECHWRRAHQIMGVGACADHGCQLVASQVSHTMGGDRRLRDAESSLPDERALEDMVRPAHEASISIARRCSSLLLTPVGLARVQGPVARWRRAPGFGLRGRDVLTAFRDRFGRDELHAIGCDVNPDDPQEWLLRMLRPKVGGFHPIQHVLLDLFAESRPDLLIRRQDPSRLSDDLGMAGHARGPGEDTSSSERGIEAVDEVDMKERGRGREDVGARGSAEFGPAPKRNPQNQRRVDWLRRDGEWASLLQDAASTLVEVSPPRKVTRPTIIAAAGLPPGAIDLLKRMPRCQAIVASAVEEVHAFECRKVRFAVAELTKRRQPLTRGHIRRLSNLTGPVTWQAVAAIESACRTFDPSKQAVITLFQSDSGLHPPKTP